MSDTADASVSDAAARRVAGNLHEGDRIDRWLRLDESGIFEVRTGKVELGQGIHLALCQIVAEELDVPVERIRVAAVDTSVSPDEGVTAGSLSIQDSGMALRQVAAEARGALLEAAAARLGVEANVLTADDGVIRAPDGRTVAYEDLISERPLDGTVQGQVAPKPASQRRLIGRSIRRSDLRGKITGQPSFIQDMELPGMLHGRIVRPPSYAASLASVDTETLASMPGTRAVVRDGDFVGLIAERESQAVRALDAAAGAVAWKEDGTALSVDPRTLPDEPAQEIVAQDVGRPGSEPVSRVISAEYTRRPVAHGSVGPSCAIAQLEGGRYTVWSHSQGIFALRHELARVLGLADEEVRVIHVEGAGCYGHNGADDVALDAALLARAVPGHPVRVQWMRDDEFAWEPFGPPMLIRLTAGLDEDGDIVEWQHDGWGPGHENRPSATRDGHVSALLAARHLADAREPARPLPPPTPARGGQRNAIPAYAFPVSRVVDHFIPASSVRTSSLRSLGAHPNVFAIESFMDEIAGTTGRDAVELRLSLLEDSRARDVLGAAADLAGWRPGQEGGHAADPTHHAPGRPDRGRGVGFARYKNLAAYAAVIVEVEVDADVRVTRAWGAIDAGMVVSHDGLLNQSEGGIVQAVSWTLHEMVRTDGPAIATRGWDSYRTLRFPEVPEVEVHVIDRPDEPPLGAGEAFAGPTAAAIANAVHNAIGLRARDLPLTREQLIAAIS